MKMPAKMKAKWLKALRSGEYGQVTGRLTNGKGGFCCLGVLQHCVSGGYCEANDASGNFMSVPSIRWYADNGIDYDQNGSDPQEGHLMTMNDGEYKDGKMVGKKKFVTIANWIEKNIETY